MKVAVIGSRSFNDYEEVKRILSSLDITELISGGAKGADTLGERYAKENGIPTNIFPPDWKKNGRAAGFIRNGEIVANADLIIAFWDGESKGTKDSIDKANKLNKKVVVITSKL
jgi:hypothetical protein